MLSEPVRAFGSLKPAALGHVVIAYRFYKIDRNDQIDGPPRVLECEDDDAALIEARKFVEGYAIEIWRDEARVGLIPADD